MERTRTATVRGKAHTEVLLQTATLSAVNESNRKTAPVRVLFDSGSQRTWIRNEIKEKLGLKPIKRQIVNLNTFGNESYKKQTCDVEKVWLTCKNNAQFEITALSFSTICSALAAKIDVTDFPPLANLEFAEEFESDDRQTPIDILIGLDLYYQIVSAERIEGDTGPVAIGSIFGYLLCGPVECSQSNGLLVNSNLSITGQERSFI